MPSPDWPDGLTSIRSGPLVARFLADNGGRMTHLVHERFGDILVPTSGPEFEPLDWPKSGAYPLFPYHNRMIGAAFEHQGTRYEVMPHPVLKTDAQHGPAHRRPWTVVSHEPDRIELGLDYRADQDWPFDFRASQRFTLNDERLDIDLSMTNTGTNTGKMSMPGGFGWHPYLAADLDAAAACDARESWPVGAAGIPTGEPPEKRHREVSLPAEGFTVFLSGWRRASVRLESGAEIVLTASAELPHLVAHRTSGYLCFEPVSHLAGVFGFAADRQRAAGLFLLQPGETRRAKVSLRLVARNCFTGRLKSLKLGA